MRCSGRPRASHPLQGKGRTTRAAAERWRWPDGDRSLIVHELHEFMDRVAAELSAEYLRIHQRAREDPGTAGDQGEENWATILRQWLPPEFPVVTKGRILGPHGDASGQLDVLVLSSAYPRYLLDKKLYLASAVVAAFECKVTLRKRDVTTAITRGIDAKRLTPRRWGSPYKETTSTLLYGVLAHTSEWGEKPGLSRLLYDVHAELLEHPDEITDIVCISDLGTWAAHKTLYACGDDKRTGFFASNGLDPFAVARAIGHEATQLGVSVGMMEYTPYATSAIGPFLVTLYRRLAWERPALRQIADYLWLAGIGGTAVTYSLAIEGHTFSDSVIEGARSGKTTELGLNEWEEWARMFYSYH